MADLEPLDLTGVERVLVVTAHPDDVDFGWAGSVATMTDAGIAVTYCIVTDGDAGGSETGIAGARWDRSGATSSARLRGSSESLTCTSSGIRTGASRRRWHCGATSVASSGKFGRTA